MEIECFVLVACPENSIVEAKVGILRLISSSDVIDDVKIND